MATNVAHDGERITIAAPAAVTSGQFVISGALFGVAQADAASGASVAIVTRGEVEINKSTALQVATVGAVLFWDAASGRATTSTTGNTRIGVATRTANTAAATIRALINCA